MLCSYTNILVSVIFVLIVSHLINSSTKKHGPGNGHKKKRIRLYERASLLIFSAKDHLNIYFFTFLVKSSSKDHFIGLETHGLIKLKSVLYVLFFKRRKIKFHLKSNKVNKHYVWQSLDLQIKAKVTLISICLNILSELHQIIALQKGKTI